MKVLVTGGGGFIGSNVVRALLARGDDVRVLDNFSTGSRANLAELENDVQLVEGDLRSYERVHAAVRGAEVVFHQGALPSVPRSVQDPLTTTAVNIEGTLNVLLTARDEGVRRIVNASSSSVYGNTGELPRVETQAPDPISPYAVAKLAAERFCTSFSRVYGMEIVSLRYFNVFGPRQDPSSQYAAVVPRFIRAIADGEAVTIYGDGEQSRDFTFVDNVVAANLLAADAAGVGGEILNVATGGSVTVNALADAIGALLGRPVEKSYEPAREADVLASWANVSEAQSLLGYEPTVDFDSGLRRTADSSPRKGLTMGHAFGSLDELGDGYGFRKIRKPLGVTAFGVNAVVMPPGYAGFHHYHDTQDELYFVHSGQARVEVEGEERTLGPGGVFHVESTTPRRVSNASETEDLVMLVVGGKDGYVERDGHMVDEADIARRAGFGSEGS